MSALSLNKKFVTVSIVSHGHCEMLIGLLEDLSKKCSAIDHVVVTHNLPSSVQLDSNIFPFKLTILENAVPKGFGANHNQAFSFCNSQFFCVLNPDVKFIENPFNMLISCLQNQNFGVVAPLAINSMGKLEDNFRFFPTPITLAKKIFFGQKNIYPLSSEHELVFPDWVAGMFLLFRKSFFEEIHGFDESYFLYYEDIDICLRIWKSNKAVVLFKEASILHNGQRDSHSNPRFLIMHISSITKFFCKHLFRFPKKKIPKQIENSV